MNPVLSRLATICGERLLDEKYLIAPSLLIGHQLTDALARSGTNWINIRVETIGSLARGVAGPELAREGMKLLSRAQSLALVEKVCAEVLDAQSYFGELRNQPGLHRAIRQTLEDLRQAGAGAASLAVPAFEDPRKAGEIRAILEQYEEELARHRFVDRAGVLRRALEKLRAKPPAAGPLYIILGHIERTGAESEFLRLLSGGAIEEIQCAGWGAARSDLFSALAEENEVREILRRVLEERTPLDHVEILYSESAAYLPLFVELTAEHGLAATFAEGVPVSYSRPGRAATGYLEWIATDFDAGVMRRLLASGAVDAGLGPVAAARELRRAQIGWGRDRYLPRLQEGPLREFIAGALEIGEPGNLTLLARGVRTFLEEHARIGSEADGVARKAICNLMAEIEELPPATYPAADAAARLRDAVAELLVGASNPRPGMLHVASLRLGGYSGRPRTFVAGLDDGRHPGASLQDPVLLDVERERLNAAIAPAQLPLMAQRPLEAAKVFAALTSLVSGRVTFSYSARDLLQDREQFPAAVLLEAWRTLPGNKDADYRALIEDLAPRAAAFIPRGEAPLTESEWWLRRWRDARAHLREEIAEAYPWLAEGAAAEEARDSAEFTVFDGRIVSAGGSLDPRVSRVPQSASGLEDFAACPFRYFLKRVLHIAPPEELERDGEIWLDARTYGSLFHEVARRFVTEVTGRGERPGRAHKERLMELAAEAARQWRDEVPPANESLFAVQLEQLQSDLAAYLREDETHCREAAPRWFEVAFGMESEGERSALDSPEPVAIAISGGSDFLLRGRVDRIDECPPGEFQVWDYKTGSDYGIDGSGAVYGGRKVQPGLYARAVEALLDRAGISGKVTRAGYYFATVKGRGQRIEASRGAPLDAALVRMFALMAAGAFPHTPEPGDCRFCDFQLVCGGAEKAASRAAAKMENTASVELQILAALRDLA